MLHGCLSCQTADATSTDKLLWQLMLDSSACCRSSEGARHKQRQQREMHVPMLDTVLALYSLDNMEVFWETQHDTHAIVAWNADMAVVVFRGTASWTNILTDIQVGFSSREYGLHNTDASSGTVSVSQEHAQAPVITELPDSQVLSTGCRVMRLGTTSFTCLLGEHALCLHLLPSHVQHLSLDMMVPDDVL